MGVNHLLLPISDVDLTSLLKTPGALPAWVEERQSDVCDLSTDGLAIIALTAESDADPLAFLSTGAPDDVSGWVGRYVETDGEARECEVDMGYGPASYYRNPFLRDVAAKLAPITPAVFERHCDVDWLEANHVYPAGWLRPDRKAGLIASFKTYRDCVMASASSGECLLVWCA